jgi:hypothetical protein
MPADMHLVLCYVSAGGLSVVLAPSWLRMFSPSEINQLISGGQGGGVDVEDMARWAVSRGHCCIHCTKQQQPSLANTGYSLGISVVVECQIYNSTSHRELHVAANTVTLRMIRSVGPVLLCHQVRAIQQRLQRVLAHHQDVLEGGC